MIRLESLRECTLPLVVLVTGMPGSGKSVVSEAAKRVGYSVVRMGDVVREIAAELGRQATDESLGDVALCIRAEHGMDVVARLTLHKACMDYRNTPIVVEGVRNLEELEFFKNHALKCYLVAVHASPQTRFSRLSTRGRSDDPRSWEDFVRRDLRELKMGLGSVIALADVVLINEGKTLEQFVEEAAKVLSEILRRHNHAQA
uniref:Flagellar hook-basal body complex protein FliE n=1 Tax=Thermofilum pendens TaxID=2269 RepID=A0A7C4FEB8_THEPE